MAAWNPDVPNPADNTPKWGSNSQPITKWEGDSSMGKLFEGVGNTLEVAAKGADYLVKHNIDEEAWNRINPEREAYTQTLEAGYKASGGKVEQPLNITAPGTPPAPQAVERSLKYVQSVTAGVEAGKINDTFYKGVIVNIAKDLRAQYPGYREYIDSKISSITGFDPANAKINELITDINSLAGKKDTEKDHTLTDIRSLNRSGEVAGAEIAYSKVRSGEWSPERGQQWIADATRGIYDEKVAKRQADKLKNTDEISQNTMAKYFEAAASRRVQNAIGSFQDATGIADNPKLLDMIDKHNRGVKKMDPTELEAVATVLNQRAFTTENQLRHLSMTANEQGKTPVDILGAKRINEMIEAQIKPMRDQAKHVSSGDLAAAQSIPRELKARQASATKAFFDDPKMGPLGLAIGAQREALGDGLLIKMVEMNLLQKGVNQEVNSFISRFIQNAADQKERPNPYGIITIKEQIDKIEVAKDKVPVAATSKAIIDNATALITATPEAGIPDSRKLGLLQSIVAPEGYGLIGKFARDKMNPDGSWVAGQASIFNQLTSPAFTREVRKITQNDPQLWAQYSAWAKNEWGTEIFNKDIRELSSVTLPAGAKIGWDSEDKKFTLLWNNKDILLERGNAPVAMGGSKYRGYETGDRTLDQIKPILNKINMGLFNIKNIGEAEGKKGTDLDAYVATFLIGAGMRPLDPNASSIPQHMMNVISGPAYKEYLKNLQKPNQIQ